MRITFISDQNVNAEYRVLGPLRALADRGHDVHLFEGEPRSVTRDLLASDVVCVHRFFNDPAYLTLVELQRAGVAVVWGDDDDAAAIPRQNPYYRAFGGSRRRIVLAGLSRMVQLADVVATSSASLADGFRALGGQDVRVIENYLPPHFGVKRTRKRAGVKVGWVACVEHQLDYHALRLRDTLHQLLEAHDDVHVTSAGLGLGLPADRYERVPWVPYPSLARHVSSYDIGIAPLVDNGFNRARSNIKLKEYAANEVAWLASPIGAYVGMGDAQGGMLVHDDEWFTAIESLVLDARRRRRLAKQGRKWSEGETIDRNVDQWESAFRDAVGARTRRPARRP